MARPRDDRLRILIAGILILIGMVWARAFQLTVLCHDALYHKAQNQQTSIARVPSIRGPVLDRGGEKLAFSIDGSALAVDPAVLPDPEGFAEAVEGYGILPADRVRTLLESGAGKRFIWLTHETIREAVACSLENAFAPGLIRRSEPKRLYPLGPAAGPLLGATGIEGQGLFGLEGRFDRYLRGVDGRVLDFRSGSSRHSGPGRVTISPPKPGATVELTIDSRFQQIVDARLREVAEEQKARGGCAILLDPTTCEILALAVYPGFDPDQVGDADSTALSVWAVAHNYEPGSTYKLTTFAAAIESGTITPEDLINCHNGARSVPGGKPIKDHEPYGVIPAWQVLAHSSNIGTGIIAERVGEEAFYRMERLLGFGVPTGVEIPGEERGRIPGPGSWSSRSLITQAFGQEISCTALQLALSYAAVANGGLLMRPYIVHSVRAPDGTLIETHGPEIVRRALRPESARILREMLRQVVTDGTGSKAEVEGLFPAGKTGTAQKFIPELGSYSTERYIASFCGFAPYDSPRWVCLVVLDEPRGTYWGGSVAAPAFARILDDVSKIDSRPTEDPRSSIRWVGREKSDEPVFAAVPRLVGLSPGLARNLLKDEGLVARFVGSGSCVARCEPTCGSRIRTGSLVSLVLSEPNDSTFGGGTTIPDLVGFPLRDVVERAQWLGFDLDVRGNGWVVEQDPPAGTPLADVRRLTVRLSADSCRSFMRLMDEGM
jgi:cell division protein FtsI (penicillin-binding protein 3)